MYPSSGESNPHTKLENNALVSSSSITISDLYSSSNPFYIKPDVFDLSYFYVTWYGK